jgi:hypothetical protein
MPSPVMTTSQLFAGVEVLQVQKVAAPETCGSGSRRWTFIAKGQRETPSAAGQGLDGIGRV